MKNYLPIQADSTILGPEKKSSEKFTKFIAFCECGKLLQKLNLVKLILSTVKKVSNKHY